MNHFKRKKYEEHEELICGCSTKLEHWEKITGEKATECGYLGCEFDTDLSGIICIPFREMQNNVEYIIPVCVVHKNHSPLRPFPLKVEVRYVKASRQITCNN